MTPAELKARIEQRDDETYFFTRATMKFFGDTMRNYGVRSAVIRTRDFDVDANVVVEMEVWELYRKRPVKHGNQSSAFFRKDTFARKFPERN